MLVEDCLFCKMVRGEIPVDTVYEDEDFLAFRDIAPQAPSHILLIPKDHLARVSDAGPEREAQLGKLLLCANTIAAQEGIVEEGMRYVINTNAAGGQEVFHLHLHILGGRSMQWPPG